MESVKIIEVKNVIRHALDNMPSCGLTSSDNEKIDKVREILATFLGDLNYYENS